MLSLCIRYRFEYKRGSSQKEPLYLLSGALSSSQISQILLRYGYMNLVLYRKYRPKLFSEIVGQEHVVQTLKNAIVSGNISHAYIFTGPRGSGKTTLARLLTKALNCQNRKKNDAEPCNKCNSCLEIMENRSIDLVEIDAASHRGIDDIRELRDGIKFAPAKSKYKIYIIDESHQITKEAANALLKTLEEPPAHAIFVLATTDAHKMIPTIISRCQRFDFKKLTMPEIVKRLKFIIGKEGVKVHESALELLAMNAGGSLRDAEGLLDQLLTFTGISAKKKEIGVDDVQELLGLVEIGLVSELCDLLLAKKAPDAIKFLNETLDGGVDIQELTKVLINYLRQVMIVKVIGSETISVDNPLVSGLTKEELDRMGNQANGFSEQDLSRCLNLFLEAENKIRFSPIPQLPLELAIIDCCASGKQ